MKSDVPRNVKSDAGAKERRPAGDYDCRSERPQESRTATGVRNSGTPMKQAAWFCRTLKKKGNRLAFLGRKLESETRQAKPSNTEATNEGRPSLATQKPLTKRASRGNIGPAARKKTNTCGAAIGLK